MDGCVAPAKRPADEGGDDDIWVDEKRRRTVDSDEGDHENGGSSQIDTCGDSRTCATAPVHMLTDDALYHLFNGTCVGGKPMFPAECRWVPALVCRRWRAIVKSITSFDAQAMASRLRSRDHRTGPCGDNLHGVVRASGMAIMARHGLATESFGLWTAVGRAPDAGVDTASILVASGVPEREAEASNIAASVSDASSWKCLVERIGPNYHWENQCFCSDVTPNATAHCVLLSVAAASASDINALAHMAASRAHGCIKMAILYAIYHDRADAVRTLLAVWHSKVSQWDLFYQLTDDMWLTVGRHGSLSVADLFLDIEQARDTVVCLSKSDRKMYKGGRRGRVHDNGRNWITEAAHTNRFECLDLCDRRGVGYGRRCVTMAAAVFQGHIDFYLRVKGRASARGPVTDRALRAAVDCGVYWTMDMGPSALEWIVQQPDFYPDDNQPLYDLFKFARKSTPDEAILRATAVALGRWPHAYRDIYYGVDQAVWRRAFDRMTIAEFADALLSGVPAEWHDAVKSLFEFQHAFWGRIRL